MQKRRGVKFDMFVCLCVSDCSHVVPEQMLEFRYFCLKGYIVGSILSYV